MKDMHVRKRYLGCRADCRRARGTPEWCLQVQVQAQAQANPPQTEEGPMRGRLGCVDGNGIGNGELRTLFLASPKRGQDGTGRESWAWTWDGIAAPVLDLVQSLRGRSRWLLLLIPPPLHRTLKPQLPHPACPCKASPRIRSFYWWVALFRSACISSRLRFRCTLSRLGFSTQTLALRTEPADEVERGDPPCGRGDSAASNETETDVLVDVVLDPTANNNVVQTGQSRVPSRGDAASPSLARDNP
ncbi:hypothetical protein EDB81DRAFT_345002 [Dactylonectria macrodidyma]|uniref:Uncharacterized protein n=1 Tax=Dactylonectria macrodidyma TaxID=307937 RepID=A0A9P9FEL5_9HYPO|nr:hypothetical protein EDB81DRAFT_345002 [Dactylonectria macrodidyma]